MDASKEPNFISLVIKKLYLIESKYFELIDLKQKQTECLLLY